MLLITQDQVLIGWVVGFVDGEGCFSVSFNLSKRVARGIEVRPSFSISQNERSRASIDAFVGLFGCGAVRFSNADRTYKYETRNLSQLRENVIPFFQKHTFRTTKQNDFLLFSEICNLMAQGQHLNAQGLENIIHKAYAMNISGQRKHLKAFLIASIRP